MHRQRMRQASRWVQVTTPSSFHQLRYYSIKPELLLSDRSCSFLIVVAVCVATSCWFVRMHCPKAGSVVFIGLVLMTAGFVLTLAGWFAPPISEAVRRVRLAGPVSLLVGLFLLAVSCCVCAVQQRKCCTCCNPEKGDDGESEDAVLGRYDHTQLSPLLLREMRLAMDRVGASSSTAASSVAASAQCSSTSLPQQQLDGLPRGNFISISGTPRTHHSPRKKRRTHASSPTSGSPRERSNSTGHQQNGGHKKPGRHRDPYDGPLQRNRSNSAGQKQPRNGSEDPWNLSSSSSGAVCVTGTLRQGTPCPVAPRPASVFLSRSALQNEVYLAPGALSPTEQADIYRKQMQVALKPLPVETPRCPNNSSPPAGRQGVALTPTIYLRTYAEDIVSAL